MMKRKIKLELTPFEAKLIFQTLYEAMDGLMEEIDNGNDDNDYCSFMHGELHKLLYKIYDKIG